MTAVRAKVFAHYQIDLSSFGGRAVMVEIRYLPNGPTGAYVYLDDVRIVFE